MEIKLGKGLYGSNYGIGVFTDTNEAIVSIGYDILKNQVETGSTITKENKGPEIVRLTMTSAYARVLAKNLLKYADMSDELKAKCDRESKSTKTFQIEENGMKCEAIYAPLDDEKSFEES